MATQSHASVRSLRPRLVLRGAVAVWLLNLALVAAAAGLLWLLDGAAPAHPEVRLAWWMLAIGFVAAELCVIHVHVRQSAHSITLGELPLVLGLVFAAPAEVALAWVVGSGLVLAAQRMPAVRLAFNLSQFAVTALLAAGVFALLGGDAAQGARTWAAAGAAVVAGSALSSPLVLAAMALSGERVQLRRIPGVMKMAVVISGVNASLGLAAATVLAVDAWAVVLLLAPAGAVFVAYRAYQAERAKHLGLEFLYAATRTLTGAGDPATGLAGMLALALETFRAEVGQVVTFGGGSGAGCVTVAADGRLALDGAVGDEVGCELHSLLDGDPAPRLVRAADMPPAVAAHLAAAGAREAMLAGLPGDRGLVGALFVANRLGAEAFDQVDRRLFGTLAAHTGSFLGQDRLERRVDELRETQRALEHQAFHDALTGLANRLLFTDRVRHALSRRQGNAAVLYIDLDDFKPVNDQLGHDAGDRLLQAVAERLHETLRTADTPARLGGDEFAVLLTDIDAAGVEVVAQRILKAFAEPVDLGTTSRSISASMGIAVAAAGDMDGDELLRNADAAMYACKHGGKRGISVYGAAA